jgi:hypothetical protein
MFPNELAAAGTPGVFCASAAGAFPVEEAPVDAAASGVDFSPRVIQTESERTTLAAQTRIHERGEGFMEHCSDLNA